MHIHIIGVAGTGMGSLAGLLVDLGHEVSGSDVHFDPPMGPALERWGVHCMQGFDPAHLDPAPDLVVVGNVCRSDNPEAVTARERGLPFTHIAGALQRFALANTAPLVVAGTHGKTTTTSLCAHLLDQVGMRPGFLIGGIPLDFERGFRVSAEAQERRLPLSEGPRRRPPFVVEGDEYDTAYFEKTAKFLHYQAEVAILTSIEHDHIDIYPDFDSYLAQFRRFIEQLPETGLIVANAADPIVVQLVTQHARSEVSYFALEGEESHGMPVHWLGAPSASDGSGSSFDLFVGGVACGRLVIPLWGRHNIKNALAAIGACSQGYGARIDALGTPLARFKGVKRRLELLGTPGGVFLYDDFAHHPTAVHTTLEGLKSKHPAARILVLFEPRSATACRNLHQERYVAALAVADQVLIAPLGRDLPADERLDTAKLAREVSAHGTTATASPNIKTMVDQVVAAANPGDVVIALSNGAFGGVHESLLERLAPKRPDPKLG